MEHCLVVVELVSFLLDELRLRRVPSFGRELHGKLPKLSYHRRVHLAEGLNWTSPGCGLERTWENGIIV